MTANHEQQTSGGSGGSFHPEAVIPVSELLEFLERHDTEVTSAVAGLEARRPDHFASSATTTEHAGEVGVQAGKRQVLDALSTLVLTALPRARPKPDPENTKKDA